MDAQPSASAGLRHVVEQSPQFSLVFHRLSQADPVDTWEADMLHYFVYELRPDSTGRAAHALFVARWEDDVPVSASLVTDSADGKPEAQNLTALLLQQLPLQ